MEHVSGGLNSFQKQHLLSSCKHIDQLLGDMERILAGWDSRNAFPKYKRDITPAQVRASRDYIGQIRSVLHQTLASQAIRTPAPQFSALHSIRVALQFALVDIEECSPDKMRGYGQVEPEAIPQLEGALEELRSAIEKMDRFLGGGESEDLQARAEKQAQMRPDLEILATIERITRELGFVEFRSALGLILDRIEDDTFEIAVFGRVSSGKSSLLNALIGGSVLPVGVNPITAIPTRIVSGPSPALRIWRASRPPEDVDLSLLADFATEQLNPGNRKQVARIRVTVPSERIPHGVVLVDTPGVGTVATSGALETVAYLPRCDYGIVLIDAGSTLSEDEMSLVRTLLDFGISMSVLLSKGDLLADDEREQVIEYTTTRLREELGMPIAVHIISTRAGWEQLLTRWIDSEILPLFERRDDMRVAAIRRRIEVLRQGLHAALLSRANQRNGSVADSGPLAEAERLLRLASSALERTRTAAIEAAYEIRRSREGAIELLAKKAVERAATNGAISGDWFASVLHAAIAADANDIANSLHELASKLADTVVQTGSVLGLSFGPVHQELTTAIRDMPVFDLGGIDFEWSPGALAFLSRALQTRRLAEKLNATIGQVVEQACISYGAVLEDWVKRTIRNIEGRFDSHADTVRAQVRTSKGSGTGPATRISAEALSQAIDQLSRPLAEMQDQPA